MDRNRAAGILCLAPPRCLPAGQAHAVIGAVLGRARAARPPVSTVVLDLSVMEDADSTWCAALLGLNDGLRAASMRLRLAGVAGQLLGRLEETGVSGQMGAGAFHPSFRSAVLACCAAMPGPGLVTGAVRRLLEEGAEEVRLPAEPAAGDRPEQGSAPREMLRAG